MPKISIVMPAYNTEEYIAGSILSVISQTYKDWELLIVDDGSSDNTGFLVEGFAAKDPRVRCFRRKNGGPSAARNHGIRKARGKYIAFLDSDDLWRPEKLAEQVKAIESKKVDVVFCSGEVNRRCADPSLALTELGFPSIGGARAIAGSPVGRFSSQRMFLHLYRSNSLYTSSVLVKRTMLERSGYFREQGILSRFCEDYDLWIRIAQAGGEFFGMNRLLFDYTLRRPGSATLNTIRMHQGALEVALEYQKSPLVSKALRTVVMLDRHKRLLEALQAQGRAREVQRLVNGLLKRDREIGELLLSDILPDHDLGE